MGNSQSSDAGANVGDPSGAAGAGGGGLKRFHTGASQDAAGRSPSPSLRRASTAGANEQPRYGGRSSSGTSSPRVTERERTWSRSAGNTLRKGATGSESPSPLGPTASRSRSRSESISALLGGAKEGKRREASSKVTRKRQGELPFQRKRSIDIGDVVDQDAMTPVSGPSTPSGTLPQRRATAPMITPSTFEQDSGNWSPMPGMPSVSSGATGLTQTQQSGDGTGKDPLGRMQPAALPSYLKIPTLIPSAYASPNSSAPSSPSAHDDGVRWSDEAVGSGGPSAALNASKRSGAAGGTAAAAILNTEDVVILPGTASKVSSPNEVVAEESGEPKTPTSSTANIAPSSPEALAKADGQGEEREEGEAEANEESSGSAVAPNSRTSTPTPGDFGGARAMTPTGRRPDGLTTLTSATPSGTDGQAESTARKTGAKLFMGSESGSNTPAFPPPKAPSSATTKPASIPSMSAADQETGPTTPTPGSSQRQDPNLRIAMPPSQSVGSMRAAASSAHARGSSLTPTNRYPHAPPVMTPRDHPMLMPIVVTWRGGGKEVFVTGTFANEWRSKILLRRSQHNKKDHSCVLHLPPGTHRLKFIVDDRWRVSRDLSTAVDGEGNLTNYIEVAHLGPAHPGPLSAPGEDLIEDEREAQRRRRQGAAPLSDSPATPKIPSNDLELRPDTSPTTPSAGGGASTAAAGGMRRSHGPTLDLLEEARRAEALRRGDLLEVFGEDKESAQEVWTQEIPESIISAQAREEAIRIEQEGGASESPSRRRRSRSHDGAEPDDDDGDRHRGGEADLPAPPALPRQLEKVILNSGPAAVSNAQSSVDDNSVLPAPNHAVLHHLTASAIKSGVIATGCTTRYRKKYITTIYYRAAT